VPNSSKRHLTLNRGLSKKTVWNIHLTLHRALEDAVKDGLLTRNPADGAYTKPKTHTETRAWDADELGAFIRATADDPLAALWRVAAMTGMRRGEILGLRWVDVDIDRGTLAVVQSRVRGDGVVETTSPKTERGRRSIDVDPITVNHLRRHRKRQIADRLEAGPAWTETELVFTRPDGAPLDPDVVSQKFNRIVKETEFRRIRFHDLRHTQATLWLKSGEPTYVVSRRLGHASEASPRCNTPTCSRDNNERRLSGSLN
jgi:integrase